MNIRVTKTWLRDPFWLAVIGSVLAHIISFFTIDEVRKAKSRQAPPEVIKVSIQEPRPPKPETPPKPKPKPKESKPKLAGHKSQKPPPDAPPAAPVQGVTKESTVESSNGMAVPLGNTLMAADEGKRLRADEVQGLDSDLSSDAILKRESFLIPEYTPLALDANLEGVFVVDVFVSQDGAVETAELRKPVGYGMDARILSAAQNAKFIPRKNRFGASVAGWAEIRFNLQIP